MVHRIDKKIISTPLAPEPIGPYSQAVEMHGTLYVSGQIGLKDSVLITESIEAETHQVMQNIDAILRASRLTFDNVVKCTIFVKDLNNFQRINEVYGKYFYSDPPARETVEVSRLPKDANVEISCIAVE